MAILLFTKKEYRNKSTFGQEDEGSDYGHHEFDALLDQLVGKYSGSRWSLGYKDLFALFIK